MTDQLFTHPRQTLDSDERFTPRWVFDTIADTFDLDPASPIDGGDCVPATVKYTRHHDGLTQPWHGYTWCNPPYSAATAWADRFRHHANGIWLGPVANSRWWIDLAHRADLLWHCRDFPFTHPTHAGRHTSMPLAFVALGQRGYDGLERLATSHRHPGALFIRERRTR